MLLEGFDAAGNVVDSAFYAAASWQTLTISGSGIVSFAFTTDGLLPSGLGTPIAGVLYDNFFFTFEDVNHIGDPGNGTAPIPEPSAVLLFAVGGLLIVGRTGRKRANA